MLAAQRQHLILQEVHNEGTVRVATLAARFDVSEMTIRRDIDALDAGGLVLRVHGGAARTDSFSALEPGFANKSALEQPAKAAIAAEALKLVRPGMTLLISGGTTTFELARLLPRNFDLTVATNSAMVAGSLAAREGTGEDSGIRTLVLGGERTPSEALVGPLTVQAVSTIAADLCFMGAHGLDLQAGITSPNLLEAEVNAAMVRASSRLVVLADSSKYGVIGLAGICPLSAVHILVTDSGIHAASTGALAALQKAVSEVRTVRLPNSRNSHAEPTSVTSPDPRQYQPPVPKGKAP